MINPGQTRQTIWYQQLARQGRRAAALRLGLVRWLGWLPPEEYQMDDQAICRMQRRRMFALSFAVTFLVMGILVMVVVLRTALPPVREEVPPAQPQQAVYLPTAADRMVLLTVSREPARGLGTFILAGFFPDTGSIPVAVLPRDTLLGETTLQQHYNAGGLAEAEQQLERALGITVHRASAMEDAALGGLLDRAGGVDWQLPVSLTDAGGRVVLTAGLQQMDGGKAARVLGHTGWPGGELQRCNTAADLLARAVNTHLPMALQEKGEEFFKAAVNACSETDLTYMDHTDHIQAARFMAHLAISPAQPLQLAGSHDAAGAFRLDQSSLELLQAAFGPQEAE